MYTPVNEPLTTARFACRYGLWYPHKRSQSKFVRALLNQIKGTVLSMRAIRAVRSDAKLVQTEDLGRIWSTAELSFQSEQFSIRRWLSFDLLCGQVDRLHPMYSYLQASGCSDDEIFWFRDNPCPPDVIGVNYYVTSDRFLDHRIDRYPEADRSAEGRFCDLSAVRVRAAGIQGFEPILLEAYQRYSLPVAITEVHLGDRPEEQIRWAAEAWEAAKRVRSSGVQCEAVTFWALLGSFFWNNLVTSDNGYYEAGVFDLSYGRPTATDLAQIVKQCAADGVLRHPALASDGWWRLPNRIEYDVEELNTDSSVLCSATLS
jgi:beta-glucosidase/6-phospho-beta-glucosidase/beta-galactosidase